MRLKTLIAAAALTCAAAGNATAAGIAIQARDRRLGGLYRTRMTPPPHSVGAASGLCRWSVEAVKPQRAATDQVTPQGDAFSVPVAASGPAISTSH
jgi:hypothetical protein